MSCAVYSDDSNSDSESINSVPSPKAKAKPALQSKPSEPMAKRKKYESDSDSISESESEDEKRKQKKRKIADPKPKQTKENKDWSVDDEFAVENDMKGGIKHGTYVVVSVNKNDDKHDISNSTFDMFGVVRTKDCDSQDLRQWHLVWFPKPSKKLTIPKFVSTKGRVLYAIGKVESDKKLLEKIISSENWNHEDDVPYLPWFYYDELIKNKAKSKPKKTIASSDRNTAWIECLKLIYAEKYKGDLSLLKKEVDLSLQKLDECIQLNNNVPPEKVFESMLRCVSEDIKKEMMAKAELALITTAMLYPNEIETILG